MRKGTGARIHSLHMTPESRRVPDLSVTTVCSRDKGWGGLYFQCQTRPIACRCSSSLFCFTALESVVNIQIADAFICEIMVSVEMKSKKMKDGLQRCLFTSITYCLTPATRSCMAFENTPKTIDSEWKILPLDVALMLIR